MEKASCHLKDIFISPARVFLPHPLSQHIVPPVEQDTKGQHSWILIGPASKSWILIGPTRK